MTTPALHELIEFVKLYGASAASRHFEMGYSAIRRRVRSANVILHRGRRRDLTLAKRNAEIRILRLEGHYLIDIGKRFNLGRERIRQILAATGGDPLQVAPDAAPDTVAALLDRQDVLNNGVKADTSPAINAVQPMPAIVSVGVTPVLQA